MHEPPDWLANKGPISSHQQPVPLPAPLTGCAELRKGGQDVLGLKLLEKLSTHRGGGGGGGRGHGFCCFGGLQGAARPMAAALVTFAHRPPRGLPPSFWRSSTAHKRHDAHWRRVPEPSGLPSALPLGAKQSPGEPRSPNIDAKPRACQLQTLQPSPNTPPAAILLSSFPTNSLVAASACPRTPEHRGAKDRGIHAARQARQHLSKGPRHQARGSAAAWSAALRSPSTGKQSGSFQKQFQPQLAIPWGGRPTQHGAYPEEHRLVPAPGPPWWKVSPNLHEWRRMRFP